MADMYHAGNRELQDQFDTRRLADRLEQVKVHDRFTLDDREFVERLDMFFLASADENGNPTCSYKGGDPGFVRVVDDSTLAFPNYDGNGMYLSMGNVAVNPSVGLLFIDFERQRRMRVDGTAKMQLALRRIPLRPSCNLRALRVKMRDVLPQRCLSRDPQLGNYPL